MTVWWVIGTVLFLALDGMLLWWLLTDDDQPGEVDDD